MNERKIQLLMLILTATAALVATIDFLYRLFPGGPELEVRIVSSETFQSNPNIEGLSGTFYYRGDQIKNLTIIRTEIVNTGRQTLIGKGERKNLIDNQIKISMGSGLGLYEITTEENEPNAQVEHNSEGFWLSFDQWRSGEKLEMSLYLSVEERSFSQYLVSKSRDIVNGSINIVNLFDRNLSQNPLYKLFSPPMVDGLRSFGIFTWVISVVFCSVLLIFVPVERVRMINWRAKNGGKFSSFLENYFGFLDDEEKQEVWRSPHDMQDVILKKYTGPTPPNTFSKRLRYDFIVWITTVRLNQKLPFSGP